MVTISVFLDIGANPIKKAKNRRVGGLVNEIKIKAAFVVGLIGPSDFGPVVSFIRAFNLG